MLTYPFNALGLAGARAAVRTRRGRAAGLRAARGAARARTPSCSPRPGRSSARCPSIERHSIEGAATGRCRQRAADGLRPSLCCARCRARGGARLRERGRRPPAATQGLHAFPLRADERRRPHVRAHPVVRLEARRRREDATSSSSRRARHFSDNGIVWSEQGRSRARRPRSRSDAALDHRLPVLALRPRPRAHRRGVTGLERAVRLQHALAAVPTPIRPSYPGLLRWSAVPGATGYMVWLVDAGQWFSTRSNVADEREYYAFHHDAACSGVVHWRVRPVRWLYGATANGLPSVSYGPWSPIYSSYNPPFATGPLPTSPPSRTSSPTRRTRRRTTSCPPSSTAATRRSGARRGALPRRRLHRRGLPQPRLPRRDRRQPGLRAAPDTARSACRPTSPRSPPPGHVPARRHRAGLVRRRLIVGEGNESESARRRRRRSHRPPGRTGRQRREGRPLGQRLVRRPLLLDGHADQRRARNDDHDDARERGTRGRHDHHGRQRRRDQSPVTPSSVGSPSASNAGRAVDRRELDHARLRPQRHPLRRRSGRPRGRRRHLPRGGADAGCLRLRPRMSFGKSSEPVVTRRRRRRSPRASRPRASSSPRPDARPRFYGQPLVAWQPAAGAGQYEVQWSPQALPVEDRGTQLTWRTSLTLPLSPGHLVLPRARARLPAGRLEAADVVVGPGAARRRRSRASESFASALEESSVRPAAAAAARRRGRRRRAGAAGRRRRARRAGSAARAGARRPRRRASGRGGSVPRPLVGRRRQRRGRCEQGWRCGAVAGAWPGSVRRCARIAGASCRGWRSRAAVSSLRDLARLAVGAVRDVEDAGLLLQDRAEPGQGRQRGLHARRPGRAARPSRRRACRRGSSTAPRRRSRRANGPAVIARLRRGRERRRRS